MSCPLLKPSLLHMALHVLQSSPLLSSVVRMEFGREVFHDGLEPLDASRLAQGEKGRCATSAFHILGPLERSWKRSLEGLRLEQGERVFLKLFRAMNGLRLCFGIVS